MAREKSKGKRLKRLYNQLKSSEDSPKLQRKIEQKIQTLENGQ